VAEIGAVAKDGAQVIGISTDVSSDADMEALAEKAFSAGPVAVACH